LKEHHSVQSGVSHRIPKGLLVRLHGAAAVLVGFKALSGALQLLVVIGFVLCFATSSHAYDALVKWSPVSAASGYKVYVRQGPNYGTGLDVGSLAAQGDGAVPFVVTGLPAGQQSFFAVTAYGARPSPPDWPPMPPPAPPAAAHRKASSRVCSPRR
jgi:hypothetical protein